MRFLPLVPSGSSPAAWAAFEAVELRQEGRLHPDWEAAAQRGQGIHAVHFAAQPWGAGLVQAALQALQPRLGPDFLVIPAETPSGRWAASKFLQALEALLEHTSGRGVKIALRPASGAVPGLVSLLKEARGEAVGFCWDAGVGPDLELIADRLFSAVGSEGADYAALQRTGYRWNLALEGRPEEAPALIEAMRTRYPPVIFPSEMPATALGRPILPDESIVFGAHWGDA